jgi:hypothetical protein
MKVTMSMLAFIKWFRGNHRLRLWTEMMSRLFTASNTYGDVIFPCPFSLYSIAFLDCVSSDAGCFFDEGPHE